MKQGKNSASSASISNSDSVMGEPNGAMDQVQRRLGVVSEGFVAIQDILKEKGISSVVQILESVQESLAQIQTIVDCCCNNSHRDSQQSHPTYFELMQLVQQVSASHDLFFLQKQLKYHISASADLPKAYANVEKIMVVLTHLLSNAIRYSPDGRNISISLREVRLRQASGIECTITNECDSFNERDRFRVFEMCYLTSQSKKNGRASMGLALCREIIQQAHGQLWVDIPQKGKVSFIFVLPCIELHDVADQDLNHTFKYDIGIVNYDKLREVYGVEKCSHFICQVEDTVRQLIRHPIDVVTAFEHSGIVSVIYETQQDTANVVAARIAKRLGAARFKVGRDQLTVEFHYHLSTMH